MAALSAWAAAIVGCAGPSDRSAVLSELDPAPMTGRAWSQAVGTYSGPVRSTTQRGGFEGESSMETRLDLAGSADDPQVAMRIDNGYSTAWAMYDERKGTYTNIPSKRYGSQGTVIASTHAPNQLLLRLKRYGLSSGAAKWMILTFRGNGTVDVDLIGNSGWRGDGELWRAPLLAMPQ